MGDFEVLEHTADVGLRAHGSTLAEVFEVATRGLAEIAGIWHSGGGDERSIEVTARDREGLLVAWLSEVLYLHDSLNVALTSVTIDDVTIDAESPTRAAGHIGTRPLQEDDDSAIQVKAVTYHQLAVCETPTGCSATVFFDI